MSIFSLFAVIIESCDDLSVILVDLDQFIEELKKINSIQFNVVEKQNQSLQFKNGKVLINLYEKCNWKGKMFSLYFKSAKKDCRLQFFFFSVENVIVKASKSTAIGQLLD